MNQLPLPFDSFPPNSHVQADHNRDGGEEGNDHRHDRHILIAEIILKILDTFKVTLHEL